MMERMALVSAFVKMDLLEMTASGMIWTMLALPASPDLNVLNVLQISMVQTVSHVLVTTEALVTMALMASARVPVRFRLQALIAVHV